MLELLSSAAGGSGFGSGGQSSADTTAQTTHVTTDISQGNISFGSGSSERSMLYVGIAALVIVVVGAMYFRSAR